MIQLNSVEQKCQDVLLEIHGMMEHSHKVGRQDFTTILGHLRDALKALENKRFGCPQGTHACACDCTMTHHGVHLKSGGKL